jgi:tripartite-type tricarboxylate transporter receptor subunit TctC
MQKTLGHPIIIENKAGAAGAIGAREVARAAPDGHTILFSNNGPSSTTPLLVKDAGYDGLKDFAPISQVASAPLFLVVHAAVPVTDLNAFIDYARRHPNKLEYATAGSGSLGHLATELLARTAGISLVHVPYKGQAEATNAIVTGQVKVLMTTSSAAMNNFIREGKVKLLAVSSGEPSQLAPGVPTIDSILPGFRVEAWFGLLAPAGTAPSVIAKLNDAVSKALSISEVAQRFRSFGMLVKPSTPEHLRDLIADESSRWARVVRDANIKAE